MTGTAGRGLRLPKPARPRMRPSATLVLCAIPVLLLAALAWRERWIADDAFVDLRVVKNIQHGLGPVYNPGERVEAFTSPLWVAVLWSVSSVLSFVALEWVAVVLGALFSVAGFAMAARGAWLLWRRTGPVQLALPLGLLAFLAVRPVWDFATSGLETGLVLAWLGGCFWIVAAVLDRDGSRARLAAVLIGLGPLVRPDLAIFSAGFLVALCAAAPTTGRLGWLRLVAWALPVPLAYQIFRMGYYAALVPNTALDKEAGLADWSRGWKYFKDFAGTYLLYLPVAALLGFVASEARAVGARPRRALLIAAAPAVCGLLHAIYIVRVGGDFMHGRMLLPSLFGLLLPVAVVPVRRSWGFALALLVVPWVVVCATSLRTPYAGTARPGPAYIADERAFYVSYAHNAHPVTVSDYRLNGFAQYGLALRRVADRGRRASILGKPQLRPDGVFSTIGPPPRFPHAPVVAASFPSIGLAGYAAGPRVFIVDQEGLADALAARTRLGPIVFPGGGRVPKRWRAGHEKYLPVAWLIARFAANPRSAIVPGVRVSSGDVTAAQAALGCGPLTRLLNAVGRPMTPGRFISNIGASFSLTTLRFPSAPAAAERELCRSR
jgi:arabinofuranosyltransferase